MSWPWWGRFTVTLTSPISAQCTTAPVSWPWWGGFTVTLTSSISSSMHHSTSELAVSSQTSCECLLRNSWLSSYFCNIPYCFTNFSFSFSNSLYKSRHNSSAIEIETAKRLVHYDPPKPHKETIGPICRLFFQAGISLYSQQIKMDYSINLHCMGTSFFETVCHIKV